LVPERWFVQEEWVRGRSVLDESSLEGLVKEVCFVQERSPKEGELLERPAADELVQNEVVQEKPR
jgi:hypothetical protein